MSSPLIIWQWLRLLRRSLLGDARDAEGGPLHVLTATTSPADDAHPRSRSLKDSHDRLREDVSPQMETCLGSRSNRKVRIVVNAGGLNPVGLRARSSCWRELGLHPKIAHVDGDDLISRTASSGSERAHCECVSRRVGIAACLDAGQTCVTVA